MHENILRNLMKNKSEEEEEEVAHSEFSLSKVRFLLMVMAIFASLKYNYLFMN